MARAHTRKLEQATTDLAPIMWDAAARPLLAYVRRTLKVIRPQLDLLIIDTRAFEREKLYVQALIEQMQLLEPPPSLARLFTAFTERVSAGFLVRDPRRRDLIRYSTEVLERSVGSWWRSETSARKLAVRIVNLKAQGLSYTEMTRQVANQYKTDFYTAEAAVRTTYNASANYRAMLELRAAGVTHKKWITSNDSRVRRGIKSEANHRAMEGVIVPIDEPFLMPSGASMMFPGDMAAPPSETINCRCSVIAG